MHPTLSNRPRCPVDITVMGFEGRSWLDRLIMRLLGKPSHTVIAFGRANSILDVRPDFPLNWTLYNPSYLYWGVPTTLATFYNVHEDSVWKLLQWVEDNKGSTYDVRGAVGLVLCWLKNASNSFYCSNMVAAALHAAGLLPVRMTRVSPRQLFVTIKAISTAVITKRT